MSKVKTRVALFDPLGRLFRKFEGVLETEASGDGLVSRGRVSEVDDEGREGLAQLDRVFFSPHYLSGSVKRAVIFINELADMSL